jgi:hypothetical protein
MSPASPGDDNDSRPDASSGEGFLTRWSRRKRQSDTEQPTAGVSTAVSGDAPAEAGEPDARPRDPETGEIIDTEWVSTLPSIADLKPGADLGAFMRKGVPEALRREALRTMWTTDPAIRDFVSPALDYAYDYNTPGAVHGFGPLTESDLEQARGFLAEVFSDVPQQPKNGQDAQQSGSRDNPSQDRPEPDLHAVRLTDAATQHEETAHMIDETGTSPQTAESAKETAEKAASESVQRTMRAASEDAGSATEVRSNTIARRRGGGATPV